MSNIGISPNEAKHTIAIVGAGFGGYRFFAELANLVRANELQDCVRFVLVDDRSKSEYGRGIAWSANQTDARTGLATFAVALSKQFAE